MKRFALSCLDHSFILSLNVKVCIRFFVFLQISLYFFICQELCWMRDLWISFTSSCVLFPVGGGVKKRLRTGGLKKFRSGGGEEWLPTKYKTRNFQNLIRKRLLRDIETKNKLKFQSATWSHYKHHDTAEFLVCVFSNSAIGI